MVDVSVVTVVKDAFRAGTATYLSQCLESVQLQADVTLEHIIIDGGSRDGTVEVIRNFKAVKHQMSWVSEPDDGIYAAMNKGLKAAKGRYVTFLNADDYYHEPNGLRESVRALDSSKADFSYAPVIILKGDGTHSTTSPHVRPDLRNLLKGMPFSHQSVLVRTDLMKRLGGFSSAYHRSADYAFIMTLVFDGRRAIRVDKDFATFRLGGFSCQKPEENQKEHAEAFRELANKYLGRELTAVELKAFVYACVMRTFGASALKDGWFGAESSVAPLIVERFKEISALRREVFSLKQSVSYRIGLIVTWPMRKIYRLAHGIHGKKVERR